MKLKNDRRTTPMGDFHLDVENLVDHFFGDRAARNGQSFTPAVSITESELTYDLVFELPGVAADDVNIEAVDGILHVSGEKKIADLKEGTTFLRNDRRKGEFGRSFEFSKSFDADGIEARFENGLLMISVPKSAKVLPKKIEIKTS